MTLQTVLIINLPVTDVQKGRKMNNRFIPWTPTNENHSEREIWFFVCFNVRRDFDDELSNFERVLDLIFGI